MSCRTSTPADDASYTDAMGEREWGFRTRALHAGARPDPTTGARAVPIYQSTSFVFEDTADAADLFALQKYGTIYTRISNPTTAAFEERMASLEGGIGAVATSSGQAAEFLTAAALTASGDNFVTSSSLYGGTHTMFDVTLGRFGIEARFVDGDDPAAFAAAIDDRTRFLYTEVIGNPSGAVADLVALGDVAAAHDLPLVVDGTFATPYLCRPMEHGADIVVHSVTKWIGGHGTSIGGVLIESGSFPWDNGKFPGMTEPSKGYHGIRFFETFGDFGFTMKARMETLRTMGPSLSPFNSFLFLQGIETLPLRMERHCANCMAVAQFLSDHPSVTWVKYAGLSDSPYQALAQKYLPMGAGGVLTFGIRGGQTAGVRFIENAQFLSHLANVGDAKTLVIHPASTTHRQLTEEEQAAAGVSPDMVRLSVGLETLDDILWDIDQALEKSQQ